jgi:hypothetical protein
MMTLKRFASNHPTILNDTNRPGSDEDLVRRVDLSGFIVYSSAIGRPKFVVNSNTLN